MDNKRKASISNGAHIQDGDDRAAKRTKKEPGVSPSPSTNHCSHCSLPIHAPPVPVPVAGSSRRGCGHAATITFKTSLPPLGRGVEEVHMHPLTELSTFYLIEPQHLSMKLDICLPRCSTRVLSLGFDNTAVNKILLSIFDCIQPANHEYSPTRITISIKKRPMSPLPHMACTFSR